MSKYCPNCGKKIPRRADFCPNCGYRFTNNVNDFQSYQPRVTREAIHNTYRRPQPRMQSYGNYAGSYYPVHRFRHWSFKVISITVILMMIFCYVAFHMFYRHTVPNNMKGATVSGTKMLSAPAANHNNNRRNPGTVIKDYSPTEYFYDEAFFGEYDYPETEFYQTYDSDNQFNYNTVNDNSDTMTDTTKNQNNNTNNVAKGKKGKVFMNTTPSSDNNSDKASDNSSSDNLDMSDNSSDSSNSDNSDSSSSDNSDSSDSSDNSDSSDSSDSSNSDSSDSSNSDSSDNNNSDSGSDTSDSDSGGGSDSDQSYHPDDNVYLDPLDDSNNNGGHKVNVQLSYTINPHTINVVMRMGKVQKNVVYHINHVYRYSNDKVKFYVSGVGKYAKYHEFTFTQDSNNQYTIYAVNGSHSSAQYFNNGQLMINKTK